MAEETEFCLLGPLLVRRNGEVLPVQPGKQRALLAALLLNADRVVPVDALAETLWASEPPASARVTVQNYVKRLRQALADTGRDRISTQPGGYLISVAAGELDVTRFEALLGAARTAARDELWGQAAVQAREALSLWRGEPLADVDSETLAQREVPRLTELRLQAIETRIDAELRLGHHADVIAELRQLVAASPLRERLHALLMIALYRDRRQAEALAVYQHARRMLIEELGIEPGAELRELQDRILKADIALAAPDAARFQADSAEPVTPRQLPRAARHFAGRSAELEQLTGLLDQGDEHGAGMVVISAISGTGGVGKTALAVHWAHQVVERFPDGQLYVNLRGYDPGQPMSAGDALAGFLRSLGVPGRDIPPEEDERAARFRSLLVGKRMLVVLDNASSAEQVRPLLPGSLAGMVLVTSRDALAGLVARDGARRLDLDLLPPADAVGLLRALIGARIDADPAAAEALAAQCCWLPLALRVAAELAASRPEVSLAELAAELADQQRSLDLLDAGGDPRTAVRGVFSWSYRHLEPGAACAFRLLGLHPGADIDTYAVAALVGTTLERACGLLDALARAHLIQSAAPGRYGMHDLLRAYAHELAAAQDGEAAERVALTRLFDHYQHTAAIAMDTLYPEERHHRPRVPASTIPTSPVTGDPSAARAWLDSERATLPAIAAHTAEYGWPSHTTRLAATLYRYLQNGGHFPEANAIHSHARAAARQMGDRVAEADALTGLGAAARPQGRYQQAADCHRQALALYRQAGDRTGEARALGNLGFIDYYRGSYEQAADHQRQAVALFHRAGDRTGQATALSGLGDALDRQGQYQQATEQYEQALALYRKAGDRTGEARALGNLGIVDQRQGRYQQATDHLQQALGLFREIADLPDEARALNQLGVLDQHRGRYQQAADYQRQALALHRETGNRSGEADTLNGLGEVLLAMSEPGRAHNHHAAALSLACQIGDKYEQARGHAGLGNAYHAAGDHDLARCHWQEALTLYTGLGAPEAEPVRAQLNMAGDPGSPSRP